MRTSSIVMAVLALILASSAAFAAATVQGRVTDVNSGLPLAGIEVHLAANGNAVVTTDANGYYTLPVPGSTSNNEVVLYSPNYNVPYDLKNFWVNDGGTYTQNYQLQHIGTVQTYYDTFNRPNTNPWGTDYCGFTEDPSHTVWYPAPSYSLAHINNNALQLERPLGTYSNGAHEGVGLGGGVLPYDFDAIYTGITISGGDPGELIFRQATDSRGGDTAPKDGYGFTLKMTATQITLARYWYGSLASSIATYTPQLAIDWSVGHQIEIRAQGYVHKVYLDGNPTPIIDCINTNTPYTTEANPPSSDFSPSNHATGGWWGFDRGSNSSMRVDGVTLNVLGPTATPVPEPGSIVALLSGLVGVVGFARRRRA